MSVILASWEADIVVPSQLRENKNLGDTHLNRKKLGIVVCVCHPIYAGNNK
jgi:hypothetical protein